MVKQVSCGDVRRVLPRRTRRADQLLCMEQAQEARPKPVPFALMELELWQEAQVGFSRKWERVISSLFAKNSALTNRSRQLTLVAASYPLYL